MKTIVTICLLLLSFQTYAQKLIRDEVDEFTGAEVRETNWNQLTNNFKLQGRYMYKLRKIDDLYLMDVKVLLTSDNVYSIEKGTPLMIKLEDGTIIELPCHKTAFSCMGCGSNGFIGSREMGMSVTFSVTRKDLLKIYNGSPVKMRYNTSSTFTDADLQPDYIRRFKEAIYLVASQR